MTQNRRLIKGIAAGGVGLGLLIGGGTFALWYDSEPLSGAVASGELSLDLAAAGSWSNQVGSISDINGYLIVPGDVLTLSQPVTINAVGDTLTALLSVDTTDITGDADLAAALEMSVAIAAPPAGVTSNGDGTYDVVAEDLGSPAAATVDVTITFPTTTDGLAPAVDRSNWWNLDAQDENVDLSAVTIDLQQTTP